MNDRPSDGVNPSTSKNPSVTPLSRTSTGVPSFRMNVASNGWFDRPATPVTTERESFKRADFDAREQPGGDATVDQAGVDVDELVGLRKRQRPKERRVDGAEDGGGGPDADRECADGHAGEQRRLPELPMRVA